MRPHKLIALGIRAALLIILISSILYFSYYYTSYSFIVYLEYIFVFIAAALSFIIILRILNHVKKHKRGRRNLIATTILLLASVIIAILYFRALSGLLDTMRIKFVNESSYVLTNIKISGCQKKQINSLNAKSYTIVWIKVTRDCSIKLSYNKNGESKTEIISAYVTTSMGQQLTYKIGTDK